MNLEETEKTRVLGSREFKCKRCKGKYTSFMNQPGICDGHNCYEKGKELGYKAK